MGGKGGGVTVITPAGLVLLKAMLFNHAFDCHLIGILLLLLLPASCKNVAKVKESRRPASSGKLASSSSSLKNLIF